MIKSDNRKEAEYQLCTTYIKNIESCRSLHDIMNFHKDIWSAGLRTNGLGPDASGMFRCTDISKMSSDDVYLGNIHGLFTLTLKQWENKRYDDPISYKIIFNQYKRHLLSNLHDLRSNIYDHGIRREALCASLAERIGAARVSITNKSLIPGKVHDLVYLHGGKETATKLLWFKDGSENRFLMPERYRQGENPVTGKQIKDTVWKDMRSGKYYKLNHSLFKGFSLQESISNNKGLKIK